LVSYPPRIRTVYAGAVLLFSGFLKGHLNVNCLLLVYYPPEFQNIRSMALVSLLPHTSLYCGYVGTIHLTMLEHVHWHGVHTEFTNIGCLLSVVESHVMCVRVTTTWRVLWLRVEETASRYGGQLRICGMYSRGQPIRCGSPAWVLGEGLTTPHRENTSFLRNVTQGLGIGFVCLRIRTSGGLL